MVPFYGIIKGEIFFFFFFSLGFRGTPGGVAAPAPIMIHPGALRREANKCSPFLSISPPTTIISYF